MTADNAWLNFAKSGRISDYLEYKMLSKEEGKDAENQHQGTDNQGLGASK